MDRRHFLTLTAILAAGRGQTLRAAGDLQVVVAGAGIVGAAIAYYLSRAGVAVTVVEGTGPASHASRGSFAWINATWAKQPRAYHRLNQESVADWHDLQRELALPVRWGGSLEWFSGAERQRRLAEQIAEQVRWGEPARMVDETGIRDLEPQLRFRGAERAAHSPNDGAVDPVLATRRLLDAAVSHGARLAIPSAVNGVRLEGSRLVAVETTSGTLRADRLVLATGAAPDLPERISGIPIPQRTTPGIIAITAPLAPLLNGVVAAPGVHLHQRVDGRVVIGEQDGPPGTHVDRLAGRPNDFPHAALAREHGQRLLGAAREYLPGLEEASLEDVYIGWRPLPLDGHPVLGSNPQRPDIYLAIMHSGVSLAPLVGQVVTRELLGEELGEKLAAYRPTRTFTRVRRY